ncbi:MAG: proteasome assembly chaperone family protein [Halobacteriaceae archaeon]
MASNKSPSFRIIHEKRPASHLISGFSSFGLAGLTAVDYIVDKLAFEQTGYVKANGFPSITPFENGTPRHHTRLYTHKDLELSVLVNEFLISQWIAEPFGNAILDWTESNSVDEITVLAGIPVAHEPDEHDIYYVATDDYRADTLANIDIQGMRSGFLDGINASLIGQGIHSDLRVGILVTPVHQQVPDVSAAIRLIEIVERVYDLDIDTKDLEQFASELEKYYQSLEERLQSMEPSEAPEDRMYM